MADSHNQDRFRLPTYLDPTRPIRLVGRAVGAAFAKQGHPPGTLVQPYRAPDEHATLRLISYANEELVERDLDGLSDLGDPEGVVWINLDGVHDVDLVRQVSEHFGLHPLLMEDLVTVGRRPKYEEYDPYLFVVLQMLTVKPGTFQVVEEQVSFVLGNGVLLTFQERQGDVFELVRERLRLHSGRIRTRGADYLCYALMDTLIDGYFGVLDALGRATEGLDADLEGTPGPETIRRIHEVKRETLILRRSVWPLREALASLLRNESERFTDETRIFLRDVYDHAVQVIDTTESLRDVLGGMIDLYLSLVSHRTNEVMRVLTVTASIFIPLTFLAGIYGMNFQHMPELAQPLGYPVLLGVMGGVVIGLLIYFRRKGWL